MRNAKVFLALALSLTLSGCAVLTGNESVTYYKDGAIVFENHHAVPNEEVRLLLSTRTNVLPVGDLACQPYGQREGLWEFVCGKALVAAGEKDSVRLATPVSWNVTYFLAGDKLPKFAKRI